MIQIRRYPDARAFLARAEPWLLEAEVERGPVLAGARQAFVSEASYEKPVYWATIEEDDKIIGCAYRTPPYRVGVTALPTAALAPLSLDLEKTYGTISGFSGVDPAASALADVWIARHGGSSEIVSRQFLLGLPAESGSGGVAGSMQLATPRDASLAKTWGNELARETGVGTLDGQLCVRLIGAQQLYYWQHGGRRCMLGLLQRTPRAAALGVVYTPPEHRGQGYASAAVAALNGQLLASGLEQRYFFIDPANRAAQALARKIGCELVQAAVDIDFR